MPSTSTSGFNKSQHSVNEASSSWAVVNKGRALPDSYTPSPLVTPSVPLRLPADFPEMHTRQDAASALQSLFAAASRQNIKLMLGSGYRSYTAQAEIYNTSLANKGQAETGSSSARPGHSEHQTGLAVDVEPTNRSCEFELCFAQTPEGRWVSANAYKYGFIVRYKEGTENLTGYEYEPWHIRYVGIALAKQIHQSNKTLEQFFNLPAFNDYPLNSFILKP
jgi:D-alanyl-D-alanine carboxypeptidase